MSRRKCAVAVEPGGMSHVTEIPPLPTGNTPCPDRGFPAWKLIALAVGGGDPEGPRRRSPASCALTTESTAATARAEAGIPQRPAIGNVRVAFAARAGPPEGPGDRRVSAIRHEVIV